MWCPTGTKILGLNELESGEYITRLKCKADSTSRSQYEVYSFVTKHNLSEAAVDELLEMLSNVSFSRVLQ